MTMRTLFVVTLGVALLGLGPAEAVVPCQPLPSPTVSVQVVDMAACQTALEFGGSCSIRTIVTNVGTGTIALSRDLTMIYSGTSNTVPPPSGIRPAGKVGIIRSSFNLGAGKNIVLTTPVVVMPGSLFVCWESPIFSANTACGSDDERRQHAVGSAGTCVISPAFVKPNAVTYKELIYCSSPEWGLSGGTCTPGHSNPAWEPWGCWLHAQYFTRVLSAPEATMWGAQNCCAQCNQPETIPWSGEGGGKSGYGMPLIAP
jgi:hypothetical protein